MSGPVVIFGLDGATFTVLDDLVRRGVMPYLGKFQAEGVRAILKSTIPPLTPPAWTTLVTGRSPGAHGIFNFLQFESPESPYLRIISSREIACESIWSIVGRAGRTAGSLNFVAHSPAPKINGYVIPGWVPWRWVKKQSHPAGLIDELKAVVPGFDVKEMAMNFKEEEKAVAGNEIQDYSHWIDLHIRRERQWFNVMRRQMRDRPVDLLGVVFDGVDKLQHLVWQYLDPACEPAHPTEEFLRTREHCWQYFRQIDDFLRETVELAGPEGLVMIASDHGFTGTREIVYINSFLEREGYLAWRPDAEVEPDESQGLGEAHPYHLTHFDMSRTRAYATSASSNGIHIAVAGVRGPEGIPPDQYESFRCELVDALRTRCVDPATGEALITDVWTRDEVFAGPKMPAAPDLTVALRDGGFFSVMRSGTLVKPRSAVMGSHHPDGVFLARGDGVLVGEQLEPLHLLDIAPTALFALGLAIPEDLEGRAFTRAFTTDYQVAHQVIYGPPTHGGADGNGRAMDWSEDQEGEAQVLMRLKALGYIE